MDEADTARHAGRVLEPAAALLTGENPNLYTIGIEFEDGGDPERVARTDEQYAAGADLIAEIAARWGIPLDRDHVIGHRELFAAKICPGNLDIDRLIREAYRPLLVCLLPVRNAEDELPGYLASAAVLADRLIALDDGSTDRTAELLEAGELVETVLRNPPRDDYRDWDDAANRQRLLDAAAGLRPRWVFFLDSDERLDPEEAAALLDFLRTDALPGCAYGFELHRMWGEERSVAGFTWVYRLFAWEPGLVLPQKRLYLNPVPEQIPEPAWVRTTIRIRHLDSPERLARRYEKYRQADPEELFEQEQAGLLGDPAPDRLERWRPRDPSMPVLDPGRVGERISERDRGAGRRGQRLACLLPVRNGEADIPGYLESVRRFADSVIALDDGSTDRTAELLEAGDLVETVLRNPPRDDYRDWDDAANRARLLREAAQRGFDWALWLDADERIDPDDAAALHRFVETEADPESAYGFRIFRMVGDTGHYDQAELWVYRLFSPAGAGELPSERLHFVPVPESIPRSNWRRTTIRIQHLASLTGERRLARFAKYAQADPDRRYQSGYSHLIRIGDPKPWKRRPPGLPVLADPLDRGTQAELDLERLDLGAPILSAIVISRNDEDRIERAVRSVVTQVCPQPFEVIVVVSGTDRTAEIVREKFPEVKLIELEGEALPGRARNAGVGAARGEYISFPGSHVELPPGSLAARIEAHERGYPLVTGSIVNGTSTLSGWASYFLDHAGALPGRPSGELDAPPAHCSYVREFVRTVGGFPEGLRAGEDTVVNRAVFNRGHRAYREQSVSLVHRSRCRNPWRLVRHHFGRGRGYGRIVVGDYRGGRALLRPPVLSSLLFRYLPSRLWRTTRQVWAWGGGLRMRYALALPLVAAGAGAAWLGVWTEILRPRRGKLRILFTDQRPRRARPVVEVVSVEDEDLLAVNRPGDGLGREGGPQEAGVDQPEVLQRRT